MDASFLFVMVGQFIGIPLLVVGIALSFPGKTRWFAMPVILFGVLGGSLITITDVYLPYTRWAVFWGGFTAIALALGTVSAVTAIVTALASVRKGNHAA